MYSNSWTDARFEQWGSDTIPNQPDEKTNSELLNSGMEGGEPQVKMLERAITPAIVCLLCAVALAGNALVFAAFAWDRSLRTITNAFLLSLAAADIIVAAASMPLFAMKHAIGGWPFGSLLCDLWLAVDYTASNASVANLLVISLDRYLSVTRPITYRAHRTWTVAGFAIGGSWLLSFVLWAPAIFLWPLIQGRNVPASECRIEFLEKSPTLTVATAVCAFYLPVTIMCALYLRVYIETRRRRHTLFALQAVVSIPLSHSISSQRCASDVSSIRKPLILSRSVPQAKEAKQVVSEEIKAHPTAGIKTTTCANFKLKTDKKGKTCNKKKFSALRQQRSAARVGPKQTLRTASGPFFIKYCKDQISAINFTDSRQVTPSRFLALCTCSPLIPGELESEGNNQWIERTLSLTQLCGGETAHKSNQCDQKREHKISCPMGRQWASCTSLRGRANTVPSTEREDADRFARRTETLLEAIKIAPTPVSPVTPISPVNPVSPTTTSALEATTSGKRSPMREGTMRLKGPLDTVRRTSSVDGGGTRDRILSGASSSFKQKQLRQQMAAREQMKKRSEYRAAKTLSAILFVFIGIYITPNLLYSRSGL